MTTTIGTTAKVAVELNGTVVESNGTSEIVRVETGFSRLYVVRTGRRTQLAATIEDARLIAGM